MAEAHAKDLAGAPAAAMDVAVAPAAAMGMITLRGDLAALAPVCTAVTGAPMPGTRKAQVAHGRGIVWMSPDEVLLLVAPEAVGAALAQIGTALAGQHHLAVDVSDARAAFTLSGPAAREVLGKLTPTDLRAAAFGPGDARRSHLGQVAAAFWMEDGGATTVVCFRSVGDYLAELLRVSIAAGPVGYV